MQVSWMQAMRDLIHWSWNAPFRQLAVSHFNNQVRSKTITGYFLLFSFTVPEWGFMFQKFQKCFNYGNQISEITRVNTIRKKEIYCYCFCFVFFSCKLTFLNRRWLSRFSWLRTDPIKVKVPQSSCSVKVLKCLQLKIQFQIKSTDLFVMWITTLQQLRK